MDKFVIDTSVVLKWFPFGGELDVIRARVWWTKLINREIELYAPTFLLVEVMNILYKKKKLDKSIITDLLDKICLSPIKFIALEKSDSKKLMTIMIVNNLTAYDSTYLLLASQLKCKIITCDEHISKTVFGVSL